MRGVPGSGPNGLKGKRRRRRMVAAVVTAHPNGHEKKFDVRQINAVAQIRVEQDRLERKAEAILAGTA